MIDLGLRSALQHKRHGASGIQTRPDVRDTEVIERSTYVLASSLAMLLLFWQWRPLGGTVWDVQSQLARLLLYGGYAFGWVLLLFATFVINHFDLFGLRQVWRHLFGKSQSDLEFGTPLL
jgi:protein-S-isoprenylcysteine O-methyltransferase Ste14